MAAPPTTPSPVGKPVFSERKNGILKSLATGALLITAIALLLQLDKILGGQDSLPEPDQIGYGLLFVAGFFTGFHCVGMCGALVVTYVAGGAQPGPRRSFGHLQYAAGKTLSYTLIGGLFGALGAIVTFTPFLRGVAGLGAGVFLLIFGLGMLNVIPALSRFRIKTPASMMQSLGQAYRKNRQPFVIGMLNGLMLICGPLQAMYIMAAGTGSPLEGAKLLFIFGLGTLPLMIGFGFLAGALSKQLAPKLVKASGAIVMALGVIMLNRGLAMTGSGYDFASLHTRLIATSQAGPPAIDQEGRQTVHMSLDGNKIDLDHHVLQRGVPVRWIIHGDQVNACNHKLTVPSLGLEFEVKKGENLVEFTPEKEGTVPWSCDMGMTSGSFVVKDPASAETETSTLAQLGPRLQTFWGQTKRWLREAKDRVLEKRHHREEAAP